ncbi:hypothetical protein [Dokdonella sp.]|uniref:hypothetical protein n=1 Tax=Dokdonella sp. TaxID=2291710 RepID=UPI003C6FE2F7
MSTFTPHSPLGRSNEFRRRRGLPVRMTAAHHERCRIDEILLESSSTEGYHIAGFTDFNKMAKP